MLERKKQQQQQTGFMPTNTGKPGDPGEQQVAGPSKR